MAPLGRNELKVTVVQWSHMASWILCSISSGYMAWHLISAKPLICTNTHLLLFEPIDINYIEILIKIQKHSLKKMHFKMSSEKWWPFSSGLSVRYPDLKFKLCKCRQEMLISLFFLQLAPQNIDTLCKEGKSKTVSSSVRNIVREC